MIHQDKLLTAVILKLFNLLAIKEIYITLEEVETFVSKENVWVDMEEFNKDPRASIKLNRKEVPLSVPELTKRIMKEMDDLLKGVK